MEGADRSAGVPQQLDSGLDDVSQRSNRVRVDHSMVAGIWFCDSRELAAGLPVKLSGIHDDSAQGSSMTADELSGGMNHDVCPMFDGSDQVGRAEGVVDDERDLVLMSDISHRLNVDDIDAWISDGFDEDCLGVFIDRFAEILGIIGSTNVVLIPSLGKVKENRL